MSRKPLPCEIAAQAQTRAALAVASARMAILRCVPDTPHRAKLLGELGALVEMLTPLDGGQPILRFRPAPAPAKRNGHTHAG